YYKAIVNALKVADCDSIPRIVPTSLKTFWNDNLNRLKQISIDLHNLWRSIGSPRHNSIINTERIKAKFEYKLAIKQAKTLSAFDKSDKINSSLAENDPSVFWKCWNSNYKSSNLSRASPVINNMSDHVEIANAFRKHFSDIYVESSDDQQAVSEFTNLS